MTSRMDQGQYLDRKTFRLNFASYRRNTHTHTMGRSLWPDHYSDPSVSVRHKMQGSLAGGVQHFTNSSWRRYGVCVNAERGRSEAPFPGSHNLISLVICTSRRAVNSVRRNVFVSGYAAHKALFQLQFVTAEQLVFPAASACSPPEAQTR